MAKVSIRALDDTSREGSDGAETRVYFDRDDEPIHLRLHDLARGARLRIGPLPADCAVYVWEGGVEAGGESLAAGSSVVVERGAALDVVGAEAASRLVAFAGAHAPAEVKAGGHVHLLPRDRVRRTDNLAGSGTKGALHADASCPTCALWLHESSMKAPDPAAPPRGDGGIHAHTEDEVIFVTAGELRFGTQHCGPGVAVAIAADTFYSFTPGPEGLSFVNFRAGLPDVVRFKGGAEVDENSYWRDLGPPDYLAPRAA